MRDQIKENAGDISKSLAALIPLLLVNSVAFTGQLIYWRTHLTWPLIADILFACALESIAVYVAYHAHLAVQSNDSASRLRAGSYTIGLLIGCLNASHFLNHGKLTAAAIGMGLMSASSPVLWGIHSRRANRDALLENGLIEPHALRLGMTRWSWHPVLSARVMSYAVWAGIHKPEEAISKYDERQLELAEPEQEPEPEENAVNPAASQATNVRTALAVLPPGLSAADIVSWLAERGVNVTPAYVRQIRSLKARYATSERRAIGHATGTGSETNGHLAGIQ